MSPETFGTMPWPWSISPSLFHIGSLGQAQLLSQTWPHLCSSPACPYPSPPRSAKSCSSPGSWTTGGPLLLPAPPLFFPGGPEALGLHRRHHSTLETTTSRHFLSLSSVVSREDSCSTTFPVHIWPSLCGPHPAGCSQGWSGGGGARRPWLSPSFPLAWLA